jgi:diguanylate cyclase (GGDEF)-like protein
MNKSQESFLIIKKLWQRKASLQTRMALFFLMLLTLIVMVTLFIVERTTFNHSTQQLNAHLYTSARVVADKINNRAIMLHAGLTTLAKDFSVKQLISSANEDQKSLYSAMENYQIARLDADIFWVLDGDNKVLVSSAQAGDINVKFASILSRQQIHWYQQNNIFYLMQAVPVRFVESSARINAWVVMGIKADRLFNNELVKLTDMHISLYHDDSKTLISSTFSPHTKSLLAATPIVIVPDMLKLNLDNESYIYATFILGDWLNIPVYTVLTANENKEYLSTQILIEQLVKVLILAAMLALIAAMLVSKSITKPLKELILAAKNISYGKYVESFPSSNTTELETLSSAISDMQLGIVEREKEINYLAFFDELTGLPNRVGFSQYIETSIVQNPHKKLFVLTLDVDRFKEINDTVSHEVGDRILILIAKRLRAYTHSQPFFARMGGDEFGMAVAESDGQDAGSIASSIVELFEQPFSINDLILDIDCSIGIGVFPDNADTYQGLLQCADIAMYSCKEQHYHYAIFEPKLNKYSVMRLDLMSQLKGALLDGQLKLYYQPKLSIQQNSISTVECLIRWIHPVHGFIAPDEFIPLAEQTGAIRHVTHWALDVACQQLQKWQSECFTFGVAVNISAIDLVDMKLPVFIAERLQNYQLQANKLTIEITESAVMTDPENALKALNTLREMGVILSIDDFGTGYSSMAKLKKMPVNELKIDKAFVLDLASNKEDQIMVKTLVSLAQNLSLETVAEGVEDKATLDFLAEIGCTKAQGFYLSKALPATEFDLWYKKFNKKAE